MGCDIHCYVEYREGPEGPEGHGWRGFGDRINPGRDYGMFGFMAGVRGDGPPVTAPRGVPKDMDWVARGDFTLFVTANEERADDDGYVPKERADRYLADGSSERWDDDRITHPDWHTPGWLTPDEFDAAIKAREGAWPQYPVDPRYKAILAAMRSLAESGDARLVFWFDN